MSRTATAKLVDPSAFDAGAAVDETALDSRGLQKMAAEAVALPKGDARRRGPFRPEVWLNAREKATARLSAFYFRLIDILAVALVTVVCARLSEPGPLAGVQVAEVAPFVLGAILTLAVAKSAGLYRFARGARLERHFAILAGAALGGGAVTALSGLLLTGAGSPWHGYLVWTGVVMACLYGLHLGWTGLVDRWRKSGALTPNVVVVGATKNAETLIQEALDRRDLNILGVFDDRLARSPETLKGVPLLGDVDALLGHKITPYVDRIVMAVDPTARSRVKALTERLASLPNEVTLLVETSEPGERSAALKRLAEAPLAPIDGVDPDRRAFHKRLQDLVIGALALVALTPLLLVIGLAVRLDSPGPMLFRQKRHGFNQEEIVVWKFRTMHHGRGDDAGVLQARPGDDRVTRVGRFLRSTSLDELPQLLNVVRGEMSLVGPRPHTPGMKTGEVECARLVAEYAHRHRMKPGMTGWAAIKGSRGPLMDAAMVRRRVQLDIDYIERQSFWLDLWIMLVTVPVLLGDRSAVR
ncbi:exopolysaccharide biosynthesis polyprenyl glycosylphosphotransferase [Brevundimonas lutea]|uniref:exopolysaccharide biosynthesis polyprenyl glycosylphosphotransferase n=1 Tax=Brevundimonas lutea TaxID=2293980 RepID=UPI001F0C9ED0|nr:exopolysaccharide biosynthesis polyprenyl glycosylphosphotransferase [Brevundimonas lutea]